MRMVMMRMVMVVRVIMMMLMSLMRVIMVVIRMIVMRMVVAMIASIVVRVDGRRGGAQGLRRMQHSPLAEERPTFGPQQPRAHRGDQQIAGDLDPPHGIVHRFRRRAEQRG